MSRINEEGYFLDIRAFGQAQKVEIDEAKFESIKIASDNLRHVWSLEELWSGVIQNYTDLEKGLLNAAVRHMTMSDYDRQALHDLQLSFAIKLANLLSSCRSYLDQTQRHLKELKPASEDSNAFKIECANQYDSRFGYRFMEAMRNYSQHRGLPLHGSSYGARVRESDLLEFNVATQIDIEKLRGDGKFKQAILAEVSENKLLAEPLVREYIAGLSAAHMAIRELLNVRVEGWMKLIRDSIAEYVKGSSSDRFIGLYAIQLGKDNEWIRSVHLGEDLLQRVETLQKRHKSLKRLPNSFVSGAPHPKKT